MSSPGRPSTFTQAVADAICERLAAGESLRSICETEGMPNPSTVLRWADAHPEFAQQYARARERGYAHLADELLDIADDGRNDYITRQTGEDGETETTLNSEHIQRSRLRVDTRKWMLSKMLPKVYGDKLTHVGDPENPLRMEVTRIERVIVDPVKA